MVYISKHITRPQINKENPRENSIALMGYINIKL